MPSSTNGLGRLRHLRRFGGIVDAYLRVPLLRTGLHSGLFEALRRPQSESELAERLGLAPDLVAAWLRAASAQGLLRRRAERYVLDPFVEWLLDAPEAPALHAALDQLAIGWAPRLEALPQLLTGAVRPALGGQEEALRVAAASRLVEARALDALARVPGARRARRVLDVGCGYGTYLAGLLGRYRDALGLGIELDPSVAEEARRRLREAEVSRRAEVRVGDFLTMELPQGTFDLILMNNNLHYFPPAEHLALFRRARSRLSPSGVLALQTPVLTDRLLARLTGAASSTAAFDLVLRTHGNLHGLPDPQALHATLRDAGFTQTGEVSILPGGAARYVWARA